LWDGVAFLKKDMVDDIVVGCAESTPLPTPRLGD
jgi:hypothetical protein